MAIFNKLNSACSGTNSASTATTYSTSSNLIPAQANSANVASTLNYQPNWVYNGSTITTTAGDYTISVDPNTYAYSWNSVYETTPRLIEQTISKLPTILKITKALFKNNKLSIKYERILDKYLPDSGTIYIPKLDLYCIFDKTDDKYWYKYLVLTCNEGEINKNKVDELNGTYCILLNDFDTKLDNTELIELADPQAYKDYAHCLLERLYYEEAVKTVKSERNNMHGKLEEKLNSLHD